MRPQVLFFNTAGQVTIAKTAVGMLVLALCLTFACNPEAVSSKSDRPVSSPALDDKISTPTPTATDGPHIYKDEFLTDVSMPIGGIGAGCIQINGKAEREYWRIFNSFHQLFVPNSFFAVRARTAGDQPIVRALQTSPVGPFEAMSSLTFRGEYSFGWFDFEDDSLPVKMSMEVFNPMIPMNEKDSAIPCAIFTLTAKNTSGKPVTVSLLATQQNAVGFTGTGKIEGRKYETYGANRNGLINRDGATVLYMFSDKPQDDPGKGDMALAVLAEDCWATADIETLENLKQDFSDDGGIAARLEKGPSPDGETIDGALAVEFTLEPGQSRDVPFVLTWYFPNATHGFAETDWIHYGNMYTNWWDDALDVVDYVVENFGSLKAQTKLFHDTLYASNLPRYLLDRLSSQFSILHSKTCFWAEDGYFGLWEGTNWDSGCCYGNCGHVYQYAQLHARLYPSIGRRLREQALSYQKDDGNIPNRQPDGSDAIDGQLGEILGCYREHLTGTNNSWLDEHWPGIKKAMEHAILRWDPDEDGALSGRQGNTLDGNLGGSTSWLGTMYLAALQASEKMAMLEEEDNTASRYRRIRREGMHRQNETLWNGEYYIQIPDAEPREDYGNGCHIDQLLGEWWASQLGLGPYYPEQRRVQALKALFTYNFRTDFEDFEFTERKFVDRADAGMLMITWPGENAPKKVIRYGNEVWTGTEYSAAATMIQNGLLDEGLKVVKAVADRHDGRRRRNIQYEGRSGNPFSDDESGKFYGRAMSIWSVLLACQGFAYDGPAGLLGFKPVWQPDNHISFFTTAQGWGLFEQNRVGTAQYNRVELRYGKLQIIQLILELPESEEPARVETFVDSTPIYSAIKLEGREMHITPEKPVVLTAGSTLRVESHLPVDKTAVEPGPRRIISLDGLWDIAEGGLEEIPSTFSHRVPVPGLADMAEPAFEQVGVKGVDERRDCFWYRRTFRVDGDIPEVALLKIHKAKYGTRVYLNGRLVADHVPCFTPGIFDVSRYLNGKGEDNELIVRVGAHRELIPKSVPSGHDFEKVRYIPGIYDSVELILTGSPHIMRVEAVPDLPASAVRVHAQVTSIGKTRDVVVRGVVREVSSGKVVGTGQSATATVPADKKKTPPFEIPIENFRLWSPEDPFLYELEVSTGTDTVKTRFGMRSFEFDSKTGRAVLNGRAYMMRGTNVCIFRFFEDPLRGDLPWREQWVRQLHRKFKSMHWNSIRYCIGFPPEIWYRVADEEGFLIQDEFPIWGEAEDLKPGELQKQYRAWMEQHCNHPCVVIWDAQNETVTEVTGEAIRTVRKWDRSARPWENGWSPPQSAGRLPAGPNDVFETHPYMFSVYKDGRGTFSLSQLSDYKVGPRNCWLDKYRRRAEGKLSIPYKAIRKLPWIINEYGWLWLNRDGTPTTLTENYYLSVLGSGATAEQRWYLYARNLAALTEFWRCSRACAGVLHFCGLGYSRPGGQTSDNFVDVEKLVFEPNFEEYVRDAFSPVGLMIDFWSDRLVAGIEHEFPVTVINDLYEDWQGPVHLRITKDEQVLFEQSKNVRVSPLGRQRVRFSAIIPDKAGKCQATAELQTPDGDFVKSVRDFEVVGTD